MPACIAETPRQNRPIAFRPKAFEEETEVKVWTFCAATHPMPNVSHPYSRRIRSYSDLTRHELVENSWKRCEVQRYDVEIEYPSQTSEKRRGAQ